MVKAHSYIIYVEMIDGTNVFVPTTSLQVEENLYQILSCNEFDPLDHLTLLEFIPGDTVFVEVTNFKDGGRGLVAKSLVYPSNHLVKKKLEFLFKAVKGTLQIGSDTKSIYKEEIALINKELKTGAFHYPAVKTVIEDFEKVREA